MFFYESCFILLGKNVLEVARTFKLKWYNYEVEKKVDY